MRKIIAALTLAAAALNYGSGALGNYDGLSKATVGTGSTLLVGDSITARCNAKYVAKAPGTAVRFWSGSPTSAAVDYVLSLPTPPKRVIMATGTNDLFNPPAIAAQIVRLKAALPDTEIYWVLPFAARAGQTLTVQLADMRNSAWVGNYIQQAIPASHIVDWYGVMAATPGRGVAISKYLQDGVHPWPSAIDGHYDGCEAWATTIDRKVP